MKQSSPPNQQHHNHHHRPFWFLVIVSAWLLIWEGRRGEETLRLQERAHHEQQESQADDDVMAETSSTRWHLIDQDPLIHNVCTSPERNIVKIKGRQDQKQYNWTIMMTLNDGFYDFFQNWYRHYQKLDLDLDIVLFTEDTVVHEKLQKANLPNVTLVTTKFEQLTGTNDASVAYSYNDKSYEILASQRPSSMLDVLCTGRNLLYVDVDTVWKQNPFPYLQLPARKNGDTTIQQQDDIGMLFVTLRLKTGLVSNVDWCIIKRIILLLNSSIAILSCWKL